MKTLKELNGVKVLSKNDQKSISGGYLQCNINYPCPPGWCCYGSHIGGFCVRDNTPGYLCYLQE